jgi:uncharacterized RDD family membrane protein YckC
LSNRAFERKAGLSNRNDDKKRYVQSGARNIIYGGLLFRLVALIIDAIIASIFIVIAGYSLLFIGGVKDDTTAMLYWTIGDVVLFWLYCAGFESSKYMATPGKMLFGLRVTDPEGNKISFIQATMRFIFKYMPAIIYSDYTRCLTIPFGLYMLLEIGYPVFSARKQSVHDKIAGTIVIYGEKERLNREWNKELTSVAREEPPREPETQQEDR